MNYKVKGLIRDPFERVSASMKILVKDLHIPGDLNPPYQRPLTSVNKFLHNQGMKIHQNV